MLYKIAYVISWSLGLLFATFPKFFYGEMTFDFKDQSLSEACGSYIFPLLMAMVLFLVDVTYSYIKEKLAGVYTNVLGVIICLIVFLLGFVFSLSIDNPDVARKCFIISWLSLSVMKLLKTELYNVKRYPVGIKIDNN